MRHVCLVNKKNIILSHQQQKKTSLKNLIFNTNKNYAGRNNSGHTTVYTKGRRNKRLYRLIDFKRQIYNIPARIYTKEYDAHRSSYISLIVYSNFICCYILSVLNVNIGDYVTSYKTDHLYELLYKKGDSNKLFYLPIGSFIHNVELWPKQGSIYIRSAGTYGKILKKTKNKVLIELPSKSYCYTSMHSFATLGVVSNNMHNKRVLGKAGRNRWLGYKSKVRGVAMNPVDHPHGGGEGKRSADSLKKSPWGKINKWVNKKRIKYLDLI